MGRRVSSHARRNLPNFKLVGVHGVVSRYFLWTWPDCNPDSGEVSCLLFLRGAFEKIVQPGYTAGKTAPVVLSWVQWLYQ